MTQCFCDTFIGDVKITGNLGVGTTTPGGRLSVVGPDGAPTRADIVQSGTGETNYLSFKRSRGTSANPQAVQTGNTLGFLIGQGYDGGDYYYGAYLSFTPTQNWGPNAHGANIRLATTPNGSATPAVRLTIAENGDVGIGTESLTARLHVSSAGAAGSVTAKMHHAGGLSNPGTALVVSNGYGLAGGSYEILGVWANNHGVAGSVSVLTAGCASGEPFVKLWV